MKHVFILLILFWYNVEFTLAKRECSVLPTFNHAYVSPEYKKPQYQRGDVIYLSCDPGYITGLNTSYICTEYGWRETTIGQCIEIDKVTENLGCTPPPPLKNGHFVKPPAYFYTHDESVGFQCDRFYQLQGGFHKTCTNGQWIGNLQCIATFCMKPLVDNGEVQEGKETYVQEDVLPFSCNPGYEKVNNESSVCLKVNSSAAPQWSPTPQCKIIYCGDPAPLLNGGVSLLSGELNRYGSVVEYYCDEPYYFLSGAVNVSFICQADGKWSAENGTDLIPTCLPVCGKPRVNLLSIARIIGGSDAPQDSIPWQVRLTGTSGGMFIADRWILTAANAVASQLHDSYPVKIFFGTNRREDDQEPTVIAASVHLHPGYNNSDQLNFDNDIALIKLSEPVTFNQSVMPICLPPEEATLQDGVMGVVSGFGIHRTASHNLFLPKRLQYVLLPVVSPSRCSESLDILRRNYSRTIPKEPHSMFCAGFKDGGKDSCGGDSGGPFALWNRDQYWVAGIVSWGVGCAERDRYGYYTQVSNFVDWIHKTMREN